MDGTGWIRDASGAPEPLLSLSPLLPVKRDQGMGHLNALTRTLTPDNAIIRKFPQSNLTPSTPTSTLNYIPEQTLPSSTHTDDHDN